MSRVLRVARPVKAAVWLIHTGLEHLEDFFVPLGNLIAIDILERSALDLCDLADLLGPETVDRHAADHRDTAVPAFPRV